MKQYIFVSVFVLIICGASAAERYNGVNVKYRRLSLTYVPQPLSGEGNSLPFIQAVVGNGSAERFGLGFDGVMPTSPWMEILDEKGRVVHVLLVNDVLGKGTMKRDRLLPKDGSVKPRRAESIYTIPLRQNVLQVIVKAVAVGDDGSPDQVIVVTFGLRSEAKTVAGLRVRLPAIGNITTAPSGFVVMSKARDAALFATVLPRSTGVQAHNNGVVLTSKPTMLEGQREAALFWLVFRGLPTSAEASPVEMKKELLRVLNGEQNQTRQSNVMVVRIAQKERAADADTVLYMMVCLNVGTAEAPEVVLESSIPQGTRYVEGSADSPSMEVNIERDPSGDVQHLRWVLPQSLPPGGEQVVSFKVVPRSLEQ